MLWAMLVVVTLVLVALALLSDKGSPLDALHGPPRFPIIGCVPFFIRLTPREMFLTLRENFQNYGDRYCVKILRRRILHICSPHDIELVLSHSKNIQKSWPYRFLEPWLGTGLLLSTGSKWLKRRKILTPTFHFNVLKSFVSVFQEKSRDLVSRLVETHGKEVALQPIISDFTLYSVCETAMGTQLDSDQSADTVAYKAAILEIGALLMKRLTRVWLHSNIIFAHSAIGKKFEKVLQRVRSFADKVILERKRSRHSVEQQLAETGTAGGRRRPAMLDLLLEAEDRGEIDLEGIREEVNTFMFEGHDTTAAAITFCLMLLADHQDVQEKVFEECQRILGGRPPSPSLSLADLSELKYLEAVIKETLRLYPSVPFIARVVTDEFMMGDLRIKVGSEVAVHIFDLHRRPDLYPEPAAFRPERFLTGRTEPDGRTHPYAFVPFSAGPRNCIGQRFAMLEMKCALSQICRTFTLQPRQRGWRPALIADLVLRTDEPIFVRFIQR